MCLQYVLSCILPEKWGPINLGGSSSCAIWFDLDLKLSMQRVLELMSVRVQESVQAFLEEVPDLDVTELGGKYCVMLNSNQIFRY